MSKPIPEEEYNAKPLTKVIQLAKGEKDPLRTERALTPLIAPEEQSDFCHRIVTFGRDVCIARSPKCGECPLTNVCAHYKREHKNEAK